MIELSRRTAVTMLPMFLVAVLFVSACSSGGDGATSSTSSSGSPAPIVAQLVQQGYLKASNTNADDLFGFNVALDGDTLVVGAPQEGSNATGVNGNQADNSAPNSGAVYVFTRTGGVWTQQAYLKASNTDAGDQFGVIMTLSGDTLAVGAQFEASNATGVNGDQTDNSTPNAGAVYVFTRTAGVWTQQAYLKASNTGAGDQFGINVVLVNDTLAVGAYGEASNATGVNGDQTDNSSPQAGAVYVFTRTAGVWTQQAYLKASNAGGLFGYGLALAGETLAVGAPFEGSNATGINGDQTDNSAPLAGAVYVFTRSAGIWSQQAYVKASNTDAGDRFGEDVMLDADTLAVGARFEASNATGINGDQTDNSAPNAGAAYVFTRTAGAWSQQAYVKASNTAANQNFSGILTIAGDLLAVGARLEDSDATGINGDQGNSNAPDSGAVYVFARNGGVWTQKDYLKASTTNTGAQFGDAVAISGSSLAVGAWFEPNNGAPKSGAVYVFDGL
jgi:hypothetical protein